MTKQNQFYTSLSTKIMALEMNQTEILNKIKDLNERLKKLEKEIK